MKINVANIPLELKQKHQWILWKAVKQGDRVRKLPINPHNGMAASSTDSSTWGSFTKCLSRSKDFSGLGFVFTGDYVGIDLDHCVDEKLNMSTHATQVLAKVNSYAEYSPSKTGIHMVCKGNISRALKTPEIEIYTKGRYFTMTGNLVENRRFIKPVDLSSFYSADAGASCAPPPIVERLKHMVPGNVDNTLTSVAGSLFRSGNDKEQVFMVLKPWANQAGHDDEALWRVVNSVARYHSPEGRYSAERVENASSVSLFLRDEVPVKWVVPGLIAENSINFVAGLPESRKTWILIDLAVELARASGGRWLGKFPLNPAKVLFIDQERFKGETQRRFKAVIKAKQLPLESLDSLYIKSGTSTRIDLSHSFDAFRKELKELRPDVVMVDSFATFHTKNENNRQDIQEVLERIKELRHEFNCAFIFIHHENKNAFNTGEDAEDPSIAHMAGSVAISAASESVFTVRKQSEGLSMVYNTKNTLASSLDPFTVSVVDVTIDKSEIKVEAN